MVSAENPNQIPDDVEGRLKISFSRCVTVTIATHIMRNCAISRFSNRLHLTPPGSSGAWKPWQKKRKDHSLFMDTEKLSVDLSHADAVVEFYSLITIGSGRNLFDSHSRPIYANWKHARNIMVAPRSTPRLLYQFQILLPPLEEKEREQQRLAVREGRLPLIWAPANWRHSVSSYSEWRSDASDTLESSRQCCGAESAEQVPILLAITDSLLLRQLWSAE